MMSDSDKSSLVNEFAEIADVNDERAKYYLESAAWNMDVMIKKKKKQNYIVSFF